MFFLTFLDPIPCPQAKVGPNKKVGVIKVMDQRMLDIQQTLDLIMEDPTTKPPPDGVLIVSPGGLVALTGRERQVDVVVGWLNTWDLCDL